MKTYSDKPTDITRKWYILDASEATLGRLSTQAAKLLMGKGKPQFTTHIDCGDYVIVINAAEVKVTGDKPTQKMYYRHSGFPGALKSRSFEDQREFDATEIIVQSVRGMIPVNKLRDGRLARLKVYAGTEHNHDAQKPEKYSVKDTQ